MHINQLSKYCFINKFDSSYINKQNKNTVIIFRNYNSDNSLQDILKFKNHCKKNNYKFLLANNIKLAIRLDLDGVYIPSFNSELSHLSYSLKKKFLIVGSAHSNQEIKIKKLQKVQILVLSSIFKKNKNYLGINRFKLLSNLSNRKIIALGGISKKNIKKLNLLNCSGFAGISYFE